MRKTLHFFLIVFLFHLYTVAQDRDSLDGGDVITKKQLKIEIVNKSGEVIDKYLKIAKLSKDGVITTTAVDDPYPAVDFSEELDRFYIIVRGAGKYGNATALCSSLLDKGATVSLKKDPKNNNDLISKELVLVSDEVDDGTVNTIGDDGSADDPTYLTALNENFSVTGFKFDIPTNEVLYPGPRTMYILTEREISVRVVNLILPNGDTSCNEDEIKEECKIADQRFAQVGLKINWEIVKLKPTQDKNTAGGLLVDLTDGISNSKGDKGEFHELIKKRAASLSLAAGIYYPEFDPRKVNIEVIYVTNFGMIPGGTSIVTTKGEAFSARIYTQKFYNDYALDKILINVKTRFMFTLAHEIGHILGVDANPYLVTDADGTISIDHQHREIMDPHTGFSDINLMRGSGTSEENVLGGSKRLTEQQENDLKLYPYFK